MSSSLPGRSLPISLRKEDLARPAQDLPVKVIKTLGQKLHQEHPNSGNWEAVAEELGFISDDIRDFRNMASVQRDQLPGELMLKNWREKGPERSLFVLLEALKRSDRLDCVSYLQNEIYDKILCMDLYVCIMDIDRRVIFQEPVRTRSESTLQESLENLLSGHITEYDFVETGITWQRSRAYEFKGKQLTLICKLVQGVASMNPFQQQNQLSRTTAAGDGTRQMFANNFSHVNNIEDLHNIQFKSLMKMQNRRPIGHCEEETANHPSQSLHSCQNMTNMYRENASLETNVKQLHEPFNIEGVKEDTCSPVHRGVISGSPQTKQQNINKVCLKCDSSSENSFQNETKKKDINHMGDIVTLHTEGPVIKNESLKRFHAQQVLDMLSETSSDDSCTLDCHIPTTSHTINTPPSEAASVVMPSFDHLTGEFMSDNENVDIALTKPYRYETLQHNLSRPCYSGYMEITIADAYTPVCENILQPVPQNLDTEVKQSKVQQTFRMDAKHSSEHWDGNDTERSAESCSFEIDHPQDDWQLRDIPQEVRPFSHLKRQSDLLPMLPQTNIKPAASFPGTTAITHQTLRESLSPVHSGLHPLSLPNPSHMQHVPQRSVRYTAPHPYRLLPGTGSRSLLDSALANDRVFSHFNTTLHGFLGWCPRETENTVERTMRSVCNEDGYYLIWYIRSKKRLVLSVSHLGKIIHYCIKNKVRDGKMLYYIFEDRIYEDVCELIRFYEANGLLPQADQTQDGGSFITYQNMRDSRRLARLTHVRLKCPVKVDYGPCRAVIV
ncbi:hypothetical protein ACJMK2_015535 [Sinanodonta woodiana]|uniref:Death domain-containing protein n=1 Tax=Sinanodonta woodiana TaxID=1069815 RepID=A0ABD3UU83_SINWO